MRTNAGELENDSPKAVRLITDCHYVHDYLDNFDNLEEANKNI